MSFVNATLSAGPGIQLAYIDSGPPSTNSAYITMIAIHGMCFTNLVFQRLLVAARNKGIRFVAPNRRHYPGSTPYTADELDLIINGGSETDQNALHLALGTELATFVDNFIKKFKIPPISSDGKTGGIVFVGWSLGAAFPLVTISSSQSVPGGVQNVLQSYIRSLVLHDPAQSVLGLPTPMQNWNPLVDTTTPEDTHLPAFGQWATLYFNQSNFTSRDENSLSYVVGSTDRVPTVYNIPQEELEGIQAFGVEGQSDLGLLLNFGPQLLAGYREAISGSQTLKSFPHMKISLLAGQRSAGFAISGMWAVQDDQQEINSTKFIDYRIIQGANHLWHWDSPEEALAGYLLNA